MTSDVDKVEREDPDNPGYLGEDRVRRDVGDLGSWVCPLWLARDETPGLRHLPNIGLIKQSSTHCIIKVKHCYEGIQMMRNFCADRDHTGGKMACKIQQGLDVDCRLSNTARK